MNFCCLYGKQEKRKAVRLYLGYSIIFILASLIAIYISVTSDREERLLVWFLVGFLGIVEVLLTLMWIDRRTWMLSKHEDSISYCNRFGRILEMQAIDIAMIYVNKYEIFEFDEDRTKERFWRLLK